MGYGGQCNGRSVGGQNGLQVHETFNYHLFVPIWIVDLRGLGSVYRKIFWARPISNFSISRPKGREIEIGDQPQSRRFFDTRTRFPLDLHNPCNVLLIRKDLRSLVFMSLPPESPDFWVHKFDQNPFSWDLSMLAEETARKKSEDL